MMEAAGDNGPLADRLLDEVVPEELDWRRLVRSYPLTALGVAAVGGFLLGRSRGSILLGAVSKFAADQVTSSVEELLGDEGL